MCIIFLNLLKLYLCILFNIEIIMKTWLFICIIPTLLIIISNKFINIEMSSKKNDKKGKKNDKDKEK